MIGACVRRGVLAGLLAGVAAGLVGLLLGEPALSAAVALEPSAPDAFPRALQLVGLVTGTALLGLAGGAVFGVLAAWAAGRVAGDVWTRSLKLGAVGVVALVILPALAFPPEAPGVPGTLDAALLWRYRLGSLATRLTLVGGTAVGYGLLASRHVRRAGA